MPEFFGWILAFLCQNVRFESHHYDWGGSKFHHDLCFPATVLPGENPLWEGKTAMQKRLW